MRLADLQGRVDAVVVGASAGGVEALGKLLPELPPGLRTPFFIVVHLPRERPSLLPEIFAARCPLKVREAEDKAKVEPATVYFAPPDYHLLLDEGPFLALSADEPVHFSRPSVDVLFESAADLYRNRVMGILLTGGNEDGAEGLDLIRKAGGVTVVQSPETASSRYMPEAALKLGPADFVLPLEQMVGLFGALMGRDAK